MAQAAEGVRAARSGARLGRDLAASVAGPEFPNPGARTESRGQRSVVISRRSTPPT